MSRSSGPIEVERKFVPGPGVEDHLRSMGAELQDEMVFQDSYYDTPDLRLTLADLWLRRRGDTWELKHPPVRGARGLTGASTQYQELNCESEIRRRVSEELGVPCPPSLENLDLEEFARFVTTRRRFLLSPQDGSDFKAVVVDLDTTDFGFAVGEVEVLVQTQEEVQNAMKKVEDICRQLGVLSESPVPGKMTTFLQRNRVEHYRQLLEAHVL
ncbi:thiamine-triphosphatase [Spea bombifrons]|uniref:thiamine-triphosphatase n=1 Tax=Spea bombifrons TaxID=233779 RepID=UPI00234BD281|nr:thiamine-triphosphatase [Spea bombifrons]